MVASNPVVDLSRLTDHELLLLFNGRLDRIDTFIGEMRAQLYDPAHGVMMRLQVIEETQRAFIRQKAEHQGAFRWAVPLVLSVALVMVGVVQSYIAYKTLRIPAPGPAARAAERYMPAR